MKDKHCCSHEASCITMVPVFRGLGEVELQRLQKQLVSHHYQKGEFIFQEGEQSRALLIVNEGLVKLSKISLDGKEQIVRLLFPGDFFGLFALLHAEKHYLHAVALEQTAICSIDKEDFLHTMEESAAMSFRFVSALNERLHEADESLSYFGLMEVEARIAAALLLFHTKMSAGDDFFTLPISKRELASFIGTTPETVSRKLVSFSDKKVLEMRGQRQIRIIDYAKLTHISGTYTI